MSRRPFDPSELDQPSADAERLITELEGYAASTAAEVPRDFETRVMAAIDREPTPRRGLLAWLLTPPATRGGLGQFARAGAVAATLVLAVSVALFAGQLADIVRNVGTGSPTPTVSPSPNSSESVVPSPSLSPSPSPSGSPQASDPSPVGTTHETLEATEQETPDGTKTPRPSATTTATETPEQSHG